MGLHLAEDPTAHHNRDTDDGDHDDRNQDQRHQGNPRDGVYGGAGDYVADWLWTVVNHHPRAEFGSVGSERNAASDQDGHGFHPGVKIGEGCERQDRTCRNSNERVNRVPRRVHQGDLVGNELDHR